MRNVVVAVFFAAVVLGVHAETQYCGKGEQCAAGNCCMLTGVRYGKPICLPMVKAGDSCRPGNQPQNFTLSYPGEDPTSYTGVYWAVCPCQASLECLVGTCA